MPETNPIDRKNFENMHQVTFSEQSKAVFQRLSQEKQLQLMTFLSDFDFQKISPDSQFTRGNKTFYRMRWKRFRIYFEHAQENLFVIHYLLPQHAWNDFLFRNHLPFNKKSVENDPRFWQQLEKFQS